MRPSQVYRCVDRCAGWLLPPRCVLCRRPGQPPAYDLCQACEAAIPCVQNPCSRCGLPCKAGEGSDDCPRCSQQDLPYERCLAPWVYEFPVTQLVQTLKYEGALTHARLFGTRLARAAGERLDRPVPADALLVPLPLHVSRLVERGFNQSHEMARVISRLLDVPLAAGALRRVRATAPQVGLARAARSANLQGAFTADAAVIAGRPVILVDDVVTTGSTAAEAATTLRAAGAGSVAVWAIARALA